jgi:hypothetical protein
MSTGMSELVEWITGHRERAARKGGVMYDGRSPCRVAADFRKDLKDDIQVTVTCTIGHYIAATGLCYEFITFLCLQKKGPFERVLRILSVFIGSKSS